MLIAKDCNAVSHTYLHNELATIRLGITVEEFNERIKYKPVERSC